MVDYSRHIPATRFVGSPSFDLKFPALPHTVVEVSHLIEHAADDMNVARLADIVEADPVVASAVLRRINSAYHGLRRRVENVRQAVALLGFLEVANIAMAAGLLKLEDAVGSPEQATIFRQIVRTCVGTSVFARVLVDYLHLQNSERAATLGLFHGIGRLVLLHNRPEDYEALWLSDEGVAPTAETERMIFGTDHRALAAAAAEHWHLPEFFPRVLANYSAPDQIDERSDRTCAYVVDAALYITETSCVDPADADVQPEPIPLRRLADVAGLSSTKELYNLAAEHGEEARRHMEAIVNRSPEQD